MRAGSLATGLLTVLGLAAGFAVQPAAAATTHAIASTNLGYTPLASPTRIADTRSGATDPSTYAGNTLCSGCSRTVDLPGLPSGAGAVVGQLTAINPTTAGYLAAYPTTVSGNPAPTANVVFTKGQTVGNLVTVAVGTDPSNGDPAIDIYNGPSGGTVDFTFDLYGYYGGPSQTSSLAYNAITPFRLLDTRSTGSALGPGSTINIPVTGVGTIPSGAGAVVLNIAVTNTTASSYIQCYPTGSPPSAGSPTVNQNWVAGETLSTQVILGVGSGGSVTCMNAAGGTDLIADADGYYSTTGDLLNALSTPTRLLDTRPSGVSPGASVSVAVQGSGATAGVLNITDIAGGPNYLTAYPSGSSVPTAANVNYTT
ncbi:MAG: hypothetical protein ACRD6W_02010, partial [Nitrososphaerales archaeon]